MPLMRCRVRAPYKSTLARMLNTSARRSLTVEQVLPQRLNLGFLSHFSRRKQLARVQGWAWTRSGALSKIATRGLSPSPLARGALALRFACLSQRGNVPVRVRNVPVRVRAALAAFFAFFYSVFWITRCPVPWGVAPLQGDTKTRGSPELVNWVMASRMAIALSIMGKLSRFWGENLRS